jgi:hypothetical protein
VSGSAAPLELIDEERVVARGTQRSTWFVRRGDAWTRAADFPGATVERRDTGPGTVWEHAVIVVLPAGTELMRVDSRPLSVAAKDPLAYLRSGAKPSPRATRRRYYKVDERGRLTALRSDRQ